MRASTLFAVTAAMLIGLGVAVAAKVGGLFSRPPEAPRRPEIQVVVANRNLFAGDTIDAAGVRLRPLKEGELDAYAKNREQYLPPVAAAAALRVAKNNIEADTPITRDMLKEMAKPAPLNERLLPDMRAVNLILPKERSAGGLVQVGEWVEVYLTSSIEGGDLKTTRTAVIAPKVRVIAKRDSLWPVFAPLPANKPVEYTLEVNAYRASLIEFARTRGTLSLSPLPQAEQKKLEAGRSERLANRPTGAPTVLTALRDDGDNEEIKLAQSLEQGSAVVSEADLVKLFDLKVEKEPSAEPPPATLKVERFIGTKRVEAALFTIDGKPTNDKLVNSTGNNRSSGVWPPAPYTPVTQLTANHVGSGAGRGANASPQWKFSQPDCPTCKKN